jgi:hypothetical protein
MTPEPAMTPESIAVWDTFRPFAGWLEYLTSHDGRLQRRKNGQLELDSDYLCTIPDALGGVIFTVGDLRALVESGRTLVQFTRAATQPSATPRGAP